MKTALIAYLLVPLGAYLLGAVPFGLILCRLIKGVDIRQHGSRNIGATNAGRVCGWPFFAATFVLDFGKGLGPVLGGLAVSRSCGAEAQLNWLGVIYGLGAILGHTFPVYVGFRGGKAVATSFGVFVALAPWAALIALGVWLVVFLPLRYVSLASIAAAAAAPVGYAILHRAELRNRWPVLAFAFAIAVLVIVRHRANIRRLLAGTENRVGARKTD
jgi:glycerol-3-phosphate acyltransferase PlsY